MLIATIMYSNSVTYSSSYLQQQYYQLPTCSSNVTNRIDYSQQQLHTVAITYMAAITYNGSYFQ